MRVAAVTLTPLTFNLSPDKGEEAGWISLPLSGSAQRKAVVRRFPQSQSNEPLVETIIDPWPKCADDIFTGRRSSSKIFRFEIQMSIPPWLKRFFDRFSKGSKVVEDSAARIVLGSDSRFRQVPMTVAEPIITLPVELGVLRV